jgi:hypothetical protein
MSQADIDRAKQGKKKRTGQRTLLVAGILTYVACFQWIYIHYLYPEFGYFGYDYNPPGTSYLTLAWVLSVLPTLWMPLQLRRPSQLAYWILYVTVLIPSMFVPLYAGLEQPSQISVLMLVLFAGFVVTGASYLIPRFHVRPAQMSSRAFWAIFGSIGLGLAIWMIVVFRHNIHIVSFLNVYDLRDTASEIEQGTYANYTYMVLSGAIDPFLMGWGLFYRKKWMFMIGALGQLLVYSVVGTKSSILSVLFACGFYVLLKNGRLKFAIKLMSVILAVSGGLCLSYEFSGNNPDSIGLLAESVVFQRTLSTGGLVTAQYFDFFQKNPVTHLSNVKGFDWFMRYPYEYPIGQEIGLAYAGTLGLDATAHFWATDGIEAFGLIGILFVSALCTLVFWVLDSVSRDRDPRLVALLISFAALNLANASIFTSLLSGGLGLLIALIHFMPMGSKNSTRTVACASC